MHAETFTTLNSDEFETTRYGVGGGGKGGSDKRLLEKK